MQKLTRTEEQILTVLWDANRPLTINEICDHAQTLGFKFNFKSIQVTTKKLLDADFLRISKTKPVCKTTVRFLEPTMTADEYAVQRFQEMNKSGSMKISKFIATLLDREKVSNEELEKLAKIVEEMKKK